MLGLIIVGVIVVLLLMWFVATFNSLVRTRNRADQSWAQVDVQLTRRHDLVPNLVNTVQGYATHEREVIERATEARGAAMNATAPAARADAENLLTASLGRLVAVAESYPQLKADANFRELQEQLADTENRIAYARQFYNDAVLGLNNATQVFPQSIVAGIAHIERRELFTPAAEERAPVQVAFG